MQIFSFLRSFITWRNNELDDVSNHQPHDCLFNLLFRRRSKKTSKLRVTGLCAGNSPVTGEFPLQRASNAENVAIWWRHHVCQKVYDGFASSTTHSSNPPPSTNHQPIYAKSPSKIHYGSDHPATGRPGLFDIRNPSGSTITVDILLSPHAFSMVESRELKIYGKIKISNMPTKFWTVIILNLPFLKIIIVCKLSPHLHNLCI